VGIALKKSKVVAGKGRLSEAVRKGVRPLAHYLDKTGGLIPFRTASQILNL
jgi:hypothetical protein